MRIRRRSLRKALVLVGCLFGQPSFPIAAVGLLGVGLGGALHLWCKGHLEQNRAITTSGPYRFSRNPFYLANFLIDLGIVLVIGRLSVGLVYLPIWLYAYHQTILAEEAHLRSLFGDELDRYVEAVPRLFPTGRRLPRSASAGRFDWQNPSLAAGREYARLMGLGLAVGAIGVAVRVRSLGLGLLRDEGAAALALGGLLGVGWLLKLALAEAMRRPQLALLPGSGRPVIRSLVLAAAVAPMLVLAIARGTRGEMLGWLLVMAGAVLLSTRRSVAMPAAIGMAALALASLGLAASSSEPWLAGLPVLGLGLGALDGFAQARLPEPRSETDRPLWSTLPKMAFGVAGTGLVILVFRWALRTPLA